MKVALCYHPYPDKSFFGEALGSDEEYFYFLDSAALLPVGTEIELIDPVTTLDIGMQVIKLIYSANDNLLTLEVTTVSGNTNAEPEEFAEYMRSEWVSDFEKVKEWAKNP